jgi:hypothetical protein
MEGRLVGVVEARELGDLAGAGLGVEALDVALLAHLERRRHVDLDEAVDLGAQLVAATAP